MTNRTSGMLVCVYYRVAAGDAPRVTAAVRELQRTLRLDAGVAEAEVLLRCQACSHAPLPEPTDDPPASLEPPVDLDADATVMETYRLPLPDAGPPADAVVRTFLATLATASLPLAPLLRGDRHVELFAPCAS